MLTLRYFSTLPKEKRKTKPSEPMFSWKACYIQQKMMEAKTHLIPGFPGKSTFQKHCDEPLATMFVSQRIVFFLVIAYKCVLCAYMHVLRYYTHIYIYMCVCKLIYIYISLLCIYVKKICKCDMYILYI